MPGDDDVADAEKFPTPNLSIFDFTAQDLKSNQHGFISDRQRAWLRSMARGIRSCSMSSATVALLFLPLGIGIILALYMSNEDSRAVLFANPSILLVLAGTAVVVVAVMGLSLLLARRQSAAVAEAQVRTVQGAIRLDQDYSPRSAITSYHVFVGDHKFSFTEDMSGIFQEGKTYRVYYCGSRPYQLILSMEELDR